MDLLASDDIVRVLVGGGQVLEEHQGGLAGETLGVISSQDGDVGLQGMGESINASIGSESLWHCHHELGINDGLRERGRGAEWERGFSRMVEGIRK